jgi:hypothetical protein
MNNKKHRKDIIENALKLKLLPQTSRLAKCIIFGTLQYLLVMVAIDTLQGKNSILS